MHRYSCITVIMLQLCFNLFRQPFENLCFEMRIPRGTYFLHKFQSPFFPVKTVPNPRVTMSQQWRRNQQQRSLKERLVSKYQPRLIPWIRPVYTQSPTMWHRGTVHTNI